jgi:signal transduction histidine kinase
LPRGFAAGRLLAIFLDARPHHSRGHPCRGGNQHDIRTVAAERRRAGPHRDGDPGFGRHGIERLGHRHPGQVRRSGHILSGEPYQFDKQPVDLVELVNAIVEDGAFEGQAHGVVLAVIGVDTAVSHVNGELIYRAIENVIRNAIKYSEPGGKVVIRTAILAGGKALQIRVEDTRPGLPDSQMEAIFRPFVRAESTGDARAGVGLGLTITRQAIELHGGSVRAHKAQPSGLIVEIVVPLTSNRPQR